MAGHRNYSGDQQAENFQRLRQYDAAVNSDNRQSNFSERLDFQREKQAFEEAYKTSEAERKASQYETSAALKGEHINILQERVKLQEEIAKKTEILKQQAEITKARATVARQDAGIEFYKGISQLDPQSHDFRTKYGELMGKVESKLVDSEGKMPEDVVKASDHLWSQHNAWSTVNQRQNPAVNVNNQMQDAFAASQPIYGALDSSKKFTPNQAGKDVQTHVQVSYLPPGATKPVTQVLPRETFDGMVAASVARNKQQPTADTASAPAPVAATPATPAATPAAPSSDPINAALDTAQQQQQAPIRMKFENGKLVPVQ